MKLLLDTHAFMWYINGNPSLSLTAKAIIDDNSNPCFVSIASIWEMAIKINLGKLKIPGPFDDLLNKINQRGFSLLPIEFADAKCVSNLENHHRDPFDRMLIAQTKIEDMAIVSNESVFDKYGVKRIW